VGLLFTSVPKDLAAPGAPLSGPDKGKNSRRQRSSRA
jgi:hypothetical protein